MSSDKKPLTEEEHKERILDIFEMNGDRGFIGKETILYGLNHLYNDHPYTEGDLDLLEEMEEAGKIIKRKIGKEERYRKLNS